MGLFNIFSKRKRLEAARADARRFAQQQSELILRLAKKRIEETHTDTTEPLVALMALGGWDADELDLAAGLPEAAIVTITTLYDQQVASGMGHRAALLFVDGTRGVPLRGGIEDSTRLEDYIRRRVCQERAEKGLDDQEDEYHTTEFVPRFIPLCIAETRVFMGGAREVSREVGTPPKPPPLPSSIVGFPSEDEVATFYEARPVIRDFGDSLVSERTPTQVLDFFLAHPGWRLLPQDVLEELSARVADRSRRWVTYDVDHALEVLVFMTEKSNALVHNFIPISRHTDPPMDTPEVKLYLFSMTFEKLASKYIRQASLRGDRFSEEQVADALEDAKAFAEASLICDRYFVTSFMPSAWGWVLKNGDVERAIAILDEGIQWARQMKNVRPHKASLFDEQCFLDVSDQVESLEATKRSILEVR